VRKITIPIALICLMIFGLSQLFADYQLDFNETTHDFGTIREADGPVNFQFSFTNNGRSEIEIFSVKAT